MGHKNKEKQLEYQKKWRAKRKADPELLAKAREYQRNYQRIWNNKPENRAKSRKASLAHYYKNRKANCDASHWRNVKRRYGITKEQYEQIIAVQGGGCALCGIPVQSSGKRLSIDHCHNSTVVRGVLCEPCNVLLGSVDAKPGWIEKVQDYLLNNPAAKVVIAKCAEVEPTGFTSKNRWQS